MSKNIFDCYVEIEYTKIVKALDVIEYKDCFDDGRDWWLIITKDKSDITEHCKDAKLWGVTHNESVFHWMLPNDKIKIYSKI